MSGREDSYQQGERKQEELWDFSCPFAAFHIAVTPVLWLEWLQFSNKKSGHRALSNAFCATGGKQRQPVLCVWGSMEAGAAVPLRLCDWVPPGRLWMRTLISLHLVSHCRLRLMEGGFLLRYWQQCKLVQPLWKTGQWFLKKLELPQDPTSPLLGTYADKMILQKDTCSPMFTATLFITAKAWKQPKRPSADERVRKMWCIHVTERYSAIGRG